MRWELLVLTGTAFWGFDALVAAADRAAGELGLRGLAQIAGGRYRPRHLRAVAFLAPEELRAQLARRPLVITHGGMGLLGDAMRAGCRIVAVPRRGRPSRRHPANDQWAFIQRLAQLQPIVACATPAELPQVLAGLLRDPGPEPAYRLESDVPAILRRFLATTAGQEGRAPISADGRERRTDGPDPA